MVAMAKNSKTTVDEALKAQPDVDTSSLIFNALVASTDPSYVKDITAAPKKLVYPRNATQEAASNLPASQRVH